MFTVVVTETVDIGGGTPEVIDRYTQTVDVIDLSKLIAAVNRKPRKPREPRAPKEK